MVPLSIPIPHGDGYGQTKRKSAISWFPRSGSRLCCLSIALGSSHRARTKAGQLLCRARGPFEIAGTNESSMLWLLLGRRTYNTGRPPGNELRRAAVNPPGASLFPRTISHGERGTLARGSVASLTRDGEYHIILTQRTSRVEHHRARYRSSAALGTTAKHCRDGASRGL
jgi:hypothetical protein